MPYHDASRGNLSSVFWLLCYISACTRSVTLSNVNVGVVINSFRERFSSLAPASNVRVTPTPRYSSVMVATRNPLGKVSASGLSY